MQELLTEDERQLLVVLVTKAWVDIRHDPEMRRAAAECEALLRKLSGVDKRVVVNGA